MAKLHVPPVVRRPRRHDVRVLRPEARIQACRRTESINQHMPKMIHTTGAHLPAWGCVVAEGRIWKRKVTRIKPRPRLTHPHPSPTPLPLCAMLGPAVRNIPPRVFPPSSVAAISPALKLLAPFSLFLKPSQPAHWCLLKVVGGVSTVARDRRHHDVCGAPSTGRQSIGRQRRHQRRLTAVPELPRRERVAVVDHHALVACLDHVDVWPKAVISFGPSIGQTERRIQRAAKDDPEEERTARRMDDDAKGRARTKGWSEQRLK